MAKVTVRSLLVDMVKGANKVAEDQQKLQTKREGTYVKAVKAGILAESAETFEEAVTSLENDIRNNVRGIAESLNCTPSKAKRKEGEPPLFTIPSSLMAAKSYILSALRGDIALVEDDGETPRSYNAIRKEVNAAKEAERLANLTGDDAIRAELHGILEGIKSRVDSAEGDNLNALRSVLLTAQTDARKAYGIDEKRAQAKAKKGKENAELAEAA